MRGKIVFITGASSGIGEGCARKFASQGSDLILNARNVAKLEELKNELEATYGVRVFLLPFDVRDRKAATQALASLPETWKAIDVLVNNAGLVIGVDKEFEGNLDESGENIPTGDETIVDALNSENTTIRAVAMIIDGNENQYTQKEIYTQVSNFLISNI